MKKLLAALSLLAVLTALMLVQPAGIVAQPNRSDLEERVATLEAEGSISRGHIQTLESHVRDLEASVEASGSGQKASDLEASIRWLNLVYVPSTQAAIVRLDKSVKDIERERAVEHFCAKPTAKERADRVGVALSKSLCLQLGGTPE